MSISQTSAIQTICELLADIVDEDGLNLSPESTADDVEDWDSLAHVNLIIALESHYQIKFESSEIGLTANVGQLADMVVSKIA